MTDLIPQSFINTNHQSLIIDHPLCIYVLPFQTLQKLWPMGYVVALPLVTVLGYRYADFLDLTRGAA